MSRTFSRNLFGWIFVVLALLAALWLALLPPEQTLGGVIRVIFLHGALVQAGLLAFAASGLLALIYLVGRSPRAMRWSIALQRTAVATWIIYALVSMVSTYLSWGQIIAWEEPRVRASAHVLWFSIACLLLARWVGSINFAALVHIVVAVASWTLVKGASLVRHPFDPIGTSGSPTYQLIFIALVLTMVAMAAIATRWMLPAQDADAAPGSLPVSNV